MLKKWINKLLGNNKSTTLKEGTVKFFNKSKRFGFITINDTEEEVFVHASNLIDKIKKTDKVTFEVEQGDKGLTAIKVRRV